MHFAGATAYSAVTHSQGALERKAANGQLANQACKGIYQRSEKLITFVHHTIITCSTALGFPTFSLESRDP